jgi:RNA polymerase-binding protein DksA
MPHRDRSAKKESAVKVAGKPEPRAEPAKPVKKGGFKKEWEPYRAALLLKRKSLMGDLHGMRDEVMGQSQQDASGDLSKMPLDMADVGSDSYEREFTISLIEGDQSILSEIDDALERMENGTYGTCINPECGKPIPKARLEIKPYARLCIECQKKSEKGQL